MDDKKKVYQVRISRRVEKNLVKLPLKIQQKFIALAEDLQVHGPAVTDWKNFSRLGKDEYHCHLSYSYWHAGAITRTP